MNHFQFTPITKSGYSNGFENKERFEGDTVVLSSARHAGQAEVVVSGRGFDVRFQPALPAPLPELLRSCQIRSGADGVFCAASEAELSSLLRCASDLFRQLQTQQREVREKQQKEVRDFHAAVELELSAGERGTEVERLVRQRIGQERYRRALLSYWGDACAVTGVTVAETLRASHARPWAECADDAQRLDVFNGFLLVANLDALFDRFLISFDDTGRILIGAGLSAQDLHGLGIHPGMTLRRLESAHRPYLQWHRERFLPGAGLKQEQAAAEAGVEGRVTGG